MSDTTPNPPPEDSDATPPPYSGEQPPSPPGSYGAPGGGTYGAPPPQPGGYPSGPQYGGGYGGAPGGIGQPADLLMRFLARLIDYFILIIIYVVISVIFGIGSVIGGDSLGKSFITSAIVAVIATVLYVGYFTVLESRNGQTVGKMLLKLKTEGPDGGTPTQEQALRRNAFNATWILGVIPFLGIVGWILWLVACIIIAVQLSNSPTGQAWHDKFAGGTKVIKIG